MQDAQGLLFDFLLEGLKKDGSRLRWRSGRAGWERFKRKKKSAVIDYFAGKVSQITRPFILKTLTMQTLNS